jgi:hypothetical protein
MARSPRLEPVRRLRFHLAAIDDQIEHAMLEEELAALEPIWQLLPNGLLDNAGPCIADQRARLGDIQVTEHRKARRDTACGWVGENRNVGNALLIESCERGTNLCHLHE